MNDKSDDQLDKLYCDIIDVVKYNLRLISLPQQPKKPKLESYFSQNTQQHFISEITKMFKSSLYSTLIVSMETENDGCNRLQV